MVETFDPDVLVEPERAERRRAAGCEVLVVEDDPDLRETLVSILEQEGYRARAARDGREALEILAGGFRPAVLLIDLIMPIMDGWELCEALVQDPKLSSLPVVLMSASGGPLPPPRPTKLVRLLRKPFTFEQLVAAIAK